MESNCAEYVKEVCESIIPIVMKISEKYGIDNSVSDTIVEKMIEMYQESNKPVFDLESLIGISPYE